MLLGDALPDVFELRRIRQRCQLAEVITNLPGGLIPVLHRGNEITPGRDLRIHSGHGWRRHPEFLKDRLERNTGRVQLLESPSTMGEPIVAIVLAYTPGLTILAKIRIDSVQFARQCPPSVG